MFSKRYTSTVQVRNFERFFLLALCDLIIIIASVWLCRALHTNSINFSIPHLYAGKFREIIIICLCIYATLGFSGCYTTSWRYADFKEYATLYFAVGISSIASYFLSRILVLKEDPFFFSDYITMGIICMCAFSIERFFAKFLRQRHARRKKSRENAKKKRVMIIGAGDTGSTFIRTLHTDNSLYPVVAIDDDKAKHGMNINDVPVIGGRDKIITAAKEYKVQEIIIAIPSAKPDEQHKLMQICRETGLKTSSVPSLFDLASGRYNITQLREVTPQELLGRSEELIDGRDIFSYIENKTVLVTGGGGSIGSELCRQIAKFCPKRLIIFDIYENNAYSLQMELRKLFPNLRLEVLIGSVRDRARLEEVFETYNPRVVFHAAAHKHVPLMEDSPNEAIKNNVYGTYNVAATCKKFDAERFVLISTDKAVNPTNIMGTSKRIAEMVVQQFALDNKNGNSKTIYTAVRFGNVLGSNGSVIPLFKQQIKDGGPVTVTHPEINRFFMTIPEAAQLVLQAGAIAEGGEIFILDMGEPVKIVDLARNLIRLSGFIPDVDIKIEFSGLRPGEKMYEELLLDKQKHTSTKNNKIFIEQPINDSELLLEEIHHLKDKLSCEIPLYEDMARWFENKFVN